MVEAEERENAAERERRWKSEEDVMSAEQGRIQENIVRGAKI